MNLEIGFKAHRGIIFSVYFFEKFEDKLFQWCEVTKKSKVKK